MIYLEDLIHHEEPSPLHPSSSSHDLPIYVPQLKQFEDHFHPHAQKDLFFDHPELLPHSSTFSQLDASDQHPVDKEKDLQVCNKRSQVRGKRINKSRNETKNIPKNFGKGIISFIEQHKGKLAPFLYKRGFNYEELVWQLRQLKRQINTIAQLRELWTGQRGQCMRIVSNLFFRKYALQYIFNSRISSYNSHIKYRSSLWQALKQPETFNHIKEY